MNIRKNTDYSEMYEALDNLMGQQLPQMKLYSEIGKVVCRRTEKGAAVMASQYLNKEYPDVKGFSPRSLRRMRDFYRTYENHPTLLFRAMKLGWIQNVIIMEADLTMELREWYMKAAKQFDWSKTGLIAMITSEVHLEIVLDNEEEVCDNGNSGKDISYISVKNSFQLFLEQLVWCVMQQRCRGSPLLQSVAFVEASYDYLVMLIADGEGKIIPNALKFPKGAFQCIQAELNGEDFEYIEDFTSPFPVEVTSDMLECFEGEFVLQEQSPNKEWLGRIGDIGEELWVYSKTRELLIDESDRQYLNDSLATVKTKIEKMLGLLGTSADSEAKSIIRDLCSEVYSGKVFDDEKYNELIECIQAMSTIKDQ